MKFTTVEKDGYTLYINEGGPVLGVGATGAILVQDATPSKTSTATVPSILTRIGGSPWKRGPRTLPPGCP
ncbi:hypothetical protein AGMMS49928_02340 [Spirochaetia bacterium]|nr:hypothetical protein AGMMS49928_02340 [Spirochaetia bacterium]